ncbi:MAG: tetratricopeptide repeat protein [Deltaproteobacteria bacterium]|nr:tetratricopeptide repeat protein [Deltaproteobacteria bacterium]
MDNTHNYNKLRLAGIILTVVISFSVYYNTLGNGFVYDDHLQIEKNEWITSAKYLPEIFKNHVYGFKADLKVTSSYRPLLMVIYMAEYFFFGLKEWGWHLLNIILHSANGVAVFFLTASLLKKGSDGASPSAIIAPLFASALFAAHPAHSEPVAWIACVPELSYTLFYLLAFYFYINTGRGGIVLSAAFYFLALLCKETAITFPAVAFIYDYSVRREGVGRHLKRYIVLSAVVLVYFAIRFAVLGGVKPGPGMHPYLDTILLSINIPVFFLDYIYALVWPVKFYPFRVFTPVLSFFEIKALVSVFFILITAGLIFRFRKVLNPLVIFTVIFFCITILPALYIPALSQNPFAERQAYLPSAGFFILIGAVAYYLMKKAPRWTAAALAALLIVTALYSWGTVKRNFEWSDDLSIWSASARAEEGNYLAMHNIGVEYGIMGRVDEAAHEYRESIKANSLRRFPDKVTLVLSHMHLARIYRQKGMRSDAVREFKEAAVIKPDYAEAYYNIALTYQEMGLCDEALDFYNQALSFPWRRQDLKDIYSNMGSCFARKGLYSEAVLSLEEALRIAPGDPAVINNLSLIRKMAD